MNPYWSNGLATLYHAHAGEIPLPDESVHMVCTSPPYYGLRKYQGVDDRVIGLESTPELYLEHLMDCFDEVWRVLRPDGVCWVNLGSSYASGGKNPNQSLGGKRALAYGNDGKELRDSLGPDSVYSGLCDGCQAALQWSGKPDNAQQNEQSLRPSLRTSHDSVIQDSVVELPHASPLVAQESTNFVSSGRLQGGCSHCANCDACLSVIGSSSRDARLCVRKRAFLSSPHSYGDATQGLYSDNPDSEEIDGASDSRITGKVSDSVSYRHSTILSHHLPAGNDLNIPHRFALKMQKAGWIHRDTVIWAKKSAMPESLAGWRYERCRVKVEGGNRGKESWRNGANGNRPQQDHDGKGFLPSVQWQPCPGCEKCIPNDGLVLRKGSWRCTDSYEYIFMFVKSMGYYADGDAVKTANTAGTIDRLGSGPVQAFSKRRPGKVFGHHGQNDLVEPNGANRRNVWQDLKPEPFGGPHYATFPSDLPRLCIQASTSERGCCPTCGSQWARVINHKVSSPRQNAGYTQDCLSRNDGDRPGSYLNGETQTLGWRHTCFHPEAQQPVPALVLDPFAGTGTTCLAAQRLGRRSVGVDLSEDYLKMAIKRLEGQTLPLGLA